MEANELIRELRIGNYVLHRGNIVAWDCDDFSQVGYGGIIMEFVQPIPLAEDILLRLGFEKEYYHGGENFKLKIDNYYSFELNKGRDWDYYCYMVVGRNEDGVNEPNIDVKYIHQLQNLYFALTEKELELKELKGI